MTFIPNLRTKKKEVGKEQVDVPKNFPYSDVLFDYAQFLRDVDTKGSIATYTGDKNIKVIVLGSGVAGVTATYELLRCGVDVTLITAENTSDDGAGRHYGRCDSTTFFKQSQRYFAERGAMRFPLSEVCLFHYINKFKIPYTDNFPDPGKVDTLLHIDDKNYLWKKGDEVPDLFKPLSNGLGALLSKNLTLENGVTLIAPETISDMLKNLKLDQAKAAWQDWITQFEAYSFRSALTLIFQQNKVSNIPGGVAWSDKDIDMFGTLGVGSGGFGSLYDIGFVEIMRLFVNELETDQQFVPGGNCFGS